MAHVRDRPSLRESVEITTPGGNRYRWADDEDNPANVPSGERFTDTMPGGFAEHDAVLPRKPAVDYADLERLSTITRYDASGGIIWQGRLERAPKVSGDQIAISPSAVGWQAHLEDDKSVRVIIVDRDLSHWGGITNTRKVNWYASNFVLHDATIGSDLLTPGVLTGFDGAWASPTMPVSEGMYDGGFEGAIKTIWYAVTSQKTVTGANDNYSWKLGTKADPDAGVYDSDSGDLQPSGPSTAYLSVTAARYGFVQLSYLATPAGADGNRNELRWELAVYGDHGLTVRGDTDPGGFYDADIIRHVVEAWCPLLTVTDESVTAGSFVIPHAASIDPTTAGEIVRQTNRYSLRDWAVWDGPTFWLHDRGARGTAWRARVGPSGLEETGPQVDRLWESVIVAYRDVDGSTRTVGPVGSGADTESDDLKDSDPENPANKLGITRRDMLTMGIGTAASATEIGRRFLEETKALDSSGRARVTGHVQDSSGVWHPYSHVRAGDTVTFVDASDTSARRIVRTDKNRDDRSCSIDLDSPPEGLQALLERLGVVLVPLSL